jgi:hypothetical protein
MSLVLFVFSLITGVLLEVDGNELSEYASVEMFRAFSVGWCVCLAIGLPARVREWFIRNP